MFVFEEVSTCFGLPIEIGRTHLTRCIEFFSDSFSEVLLLFRRAAAAAAATSAAAAETSSEYFDFCSAFFRFETKAEFFFKQENKVAPFFFRGASVSFFSTRKSVFLRRENKFQYFFIIKSSNRFKKSVKYSIEVSQESVLSLSCASFEGCRECLFQKLLRRMMSLPSSSSSF